MKKIIAFIVTIVLCLSFAGCTSKKSPEPQEPPCVKISFPEGYTTVQVANLLEKKNVCKASEFLNLTKTVRDNFSYSKKIKNSKDRVFLLEGYIFPNTYDFFINEGAESALNRFLTSFSKNITQEDINRANKLGMSIDQIITLASVIQAEAGVPAEMGKVSSVFHNRMNSSYKKLESDVTYFYITKKVKDFIPTKEEQDKFLKLYNTYDISGLPAGPICNPGKAAIHAALYPDDTNYLFFVTDKKTNEYYYAQTFAQHKKNCKKAGL